MVYYATPAPAAPSDAFRREGLTLTWTGWDGSIWDLGSRQSGVFLLAGVRGLHMPTGTRHRDTSPGAHGSQHRGTLWEEREVFWPVKTWHGESGSQFMDRDSAFWRTMDPDLPGRWTITRQGVASRHLDLRYEPATKDEGFEVLPSLRGWAHYSIYLTADQPFFTGAPTVKSWPVPAIGSATLTTSGDVPAPSAWHLDGPIEAGAYIEVGGRRTTIPFNIPDWFVLVIDTDPTRLGATLYHISNTAGRARPAADRVLGRDLDSPQDRNRQVGRILQSPIRPGAPAQTFFSAQGTGAAKIEAVIPAYYKRAW